ncbi:MAG: hypothetical protein AAGJ46_16415 [Planctomycetota bacterium]
MPQSKSLADASPEEMLKELRRRGMHSVLLTPENKHDPLLGEEASGKATPVQEIGADQFKGAALAKAYRRLAEQAESRKQAEEAAREQIEGDVFNLKGDELGMSLGDFKRKHFRRVPGSEKLAPLCSDEFPDQRIESLLSEAWHTSAGIVHARIDLPEEKAPPTVAGVPSELMIYQFLDGRLFQVSSFFGYDAFHPLSAALVNKFGTPVDEDKKPRASRWWTLSSTIELVAGGIRPKTPTRLSYRHDDLLKEAARRQPAPHLDL